jgi:hypothetical protein
LAMSLQLEAARVFEAHQGVSDGLCKWSGPHSNGEH